MNLKQLSYFCRVVDLGNMTAAAEKFRVAQPALGAQIRQLEDELGVELFIRHSRGVTVTEAGELLYDHAQTILRSVERASDDVRNLGKSRRKPVRLGLNSSTVRVIGPERLIDAQQESPNLDISILEDRTQLLAEGVARGEIDLALLNNAESFAGLDRKPVLEEDLFFVTAPDRIPGNGSGDTIDFAEALKHELAIGRERGVMRRIVSAEADKLSLEVKVAYELYSVAARKALVRRGDAASIVSYNLVADEIREGHLSGRRIVRPEMARTLFVVRQHAFEEGSRPEVDRYIDTLIDMYLASMAPWARRV